MKNNPPEAVTLDNCASEPIHIPGSIQPHGALLAFDRQCLLTHVSANAQALLRVALVPGAHVDALRPIDAAQYLNGAISQACASLGVEPYVPETFKTVIDSQTFDVMIHTLNDRVICEFEPRVSSDDEIDRFSQKAYRAMTRLKGQRTLERLLEAAVQEVREITGFDRVMAYRFRHDDSGDVVAESCRDDLDPYLGRRYPASDIPAQARHLYVLNTLRMIADVGYTPVPLQAGATERRPLDLSHSVLRSVSPIHIEYLGNMGVAASMSVSIVVAGRLWGMIACHHMAPLRVPHSVRMAVDVMAQLIASTVQSLIAQQRESEMARASLLRSQIAEQVAQGQEAADVLAGEVETLRSSFNADAMLISVAGVQRSFGPIDPAWAAALIGRLNQQSEPLVQVDHCAQLPPQADEGAPKYCGMLALHVDLQRSGWLVALRREQIETIRWGGRPEKEITHGPLGPRLTPRGSFEEWRETVRDTAEPWTGAEREAASLLLDSIHRAGVARMVEADRLRSQFWAVLGHDMRDPLQSLSVASSVLSRGSAPERMATVIKNSTNRMQHLLRDLQDITRIQNGLGLSLEIADVDLGELLAQIDHEARTAYPLMELELRAPAHLVVPVDTMRLRQLVSNLLSNARHHGKGKVLMTLESAASDPTTVMLQVSNPADPLPQELVASLFDPFKRKSLSNQKNPGGMGLGLYIVDQIARAHRGSVRYHAANGWIHFSLTLPAAST